MKEISSDVKTFSEKMKLLREEKGLTRQALSRELGIHFNSVNEYEKGRVPSLDNLKKITKYYNVSYDYLFSDTDIRTNDIDVQLLVKELGLSEKAVTFLKSLDKNDKLLQYISTIIENTSKYLNNKKDNQN